MSPLVLKHQIETAVVPPCKVSNDSCLVFLLPCFGCEISSWCSLAFMPAAGVLTCVFNHNILTSLCQAYKSAQWLHYEILCYRVHLTLLHYPTLSHISLWISPHPPFYLSESRKERPISMGLFPLPGYDLTSDSQREAVETPSEAWRCKDLSHARSNTSLKVSIYSSPASHF